MAPSALHHQLQLAYSTHNPIHRCISASLNKANPELPHETTTWKQPVYHPTTLNEAPPQFRPFESIPLEIIERILSLLPLDALLRLKRLNRSFFLLLTSPHLYTTIHLPSSPTPHPSLLGILPSLLPGTTTLSLRSFALPPLQHLLPHLTSRLTHLDLSFSAVRDEQLALLAANGALQGVRECRLKGCRGVRDGEWLAGVLPSVRVLDLSWSGLDNLPRGCACAEPSSFDFDSEGEAQEQLSVSPTYSNDSGFFDLFPSPSYSPLPTPFPSLQTLSLSSLPYLPLPLLSQFLTSLPQSLETLDLSHLALPPSFLSLLRPPAGLRVLDLRGNDRLTRRGIESLRSRCKGVSVKHSALLLESEAEEDVRRFVEMVSGLAARRGESADV